MKMKLSEIFIFYAHLILHNNNSYMCDFKYIYTCKNYLCLQILVTETVRTRPSSKLSSLPSYVMQLIFC